MLNTFPLWEATISSIKGWGFLLKNNCPYLLLLSFLLPHHPRSFSLFLLASLHFLLLLIYCNRSSSRIFPFISEEVWDMHLWELMHVYNIIRKAQSPPWFGQYALWQPQTNQKLQNTRLFQVLPHLWFLERFFKKGRRNNTKNEVYFGNF